MMPRADDCVVSPEGRACAGTPAGIADPFEGTLASGGTRAGGILEALLISEEGSEPGSVLRNTGPSDATTVATAPMMATTIATHAALLLSLKARLPVADLWPPRAKCHRLDGAIGRRLRSPY